MPRGEDPIERIAVDVVDPGEPRLPDPGAEESEPDPRSGFVPDHGAEEEAEEGEGEGDGLELPEGTVILYDESGQPYLGIPIDPSDVPPEEEA